MYTVIGTQKSRAFRVLWLLEEMGVAYDHQPAAPRSDQARTHFQAGKIPILLDGDVAISDSIAIMTFLADRHGQFTFAPGTHERAKQDGFTHFLLDEFDACLWTAARHSFVLPEDHRVPAVKAPLKWEFERSMGRFLDRLGDGPYLMGEDITLPDFIAAHCGKWALAAGFPVDNPAFQTYYQRLTSRPAFGRVLEMG